MQLLRDRAADSAPRNPQEEHPQPWTGASGAASASTGTPAPGSSGSGGGGAATAPAIPPIHPNDHVNLGQSSNDVVPTAMHVALARSLAHRLLPALHVLGEALERKAAEWSGVVKVGRTHLMVSEAGLALRRRVR